MFVETMVTVTLAASPADVPSVPTLMELAATRATQRAARGGDPVPQALLVAAMAQAETLLESDGVPLDETARDWLRERLVKRLEGELARVPSQTGPARLEAWEHLVRRVTTPLLAQQVLDEWLELPPIKLPEAPVSKGAWSQTTQLEGADSFTLERVTVQEEVGSEGLINQLIDPGEWVRLEVGLVNATRLPWFSTSAWPKTEGCVWVDEKRSSVVGEMAPGARATVSFWAYVPEQCTETTTLRLALSDTHRGTPVGTFGLALTPTSFVRPRAKRTRLDMDVLGSSDGSGLSRVGPSMRFEFVADVQMPAEGVSSVVSRWSVADSARALFKRLGFREVQAVPSSAGLFAAGDDVDGETVDGETWAMVAANPALERWLMEPASGRIWLAMDTSVELTGTVPGLPPPPSPPNASAVRQPRPARSAAVMPVANAPAPATPAASTVAELVRQFVQLEPHAVPKERPDAVSAASGYELVFDRSGFMKAYEALLTPPATPPVVPVAPSVRYVVRSYMAVPAVAAAPAPPPAREVPPPPREAPRKPWFQVDLAGGFSVFGTSATASRPNLWQGAAIGVFPTGGLRGFIGPHLVGVVALHYATVSVGPSTLTEFTGELGMGYSFRWEHASLTPYGAVLLRLREHNQIGNLIAIGGVAGINGRVLLTSWFGLFVDLAAPITMGGPAGFDANRMSVDVVSGLGLRATAGLSFTF